jgi:MFS family permease
MRILEYVKKLLASIADTRVRASLAASTVDGALWALMYGFSEYFILPFAIFFGADTMQTSLVQGMGQLGVAAAQLVGAALVARHGQRKHLTRWSVAIHAASWLAAFWAAALTKSPWTIIALYSLGVFATSLSSPGWLSWMNDLMPPSIRGAFWGKRNMVAGLVQFAAIMIAGTALHFAEHSGLTLIVFGVLFTLAALSRGGSVIALGFQHEPPMEAERAGDHQGFLAFLRALPHGSFGRFVIFSVLMTFAVNIMGPVFSVYLLKSRGLGYFSYTAVTMVSLVLSFVAMSYWGPLTDRYGNRRILLVSSGALPLIALGWAFAKSFPAMIALQVLSGFAWAGVNLSTTNYIFDSVDKKGMSSAMANFNALNNICAFLGSVSGGLVATAVAGLAIPIFAPRNIEIVFILSALLRLVVLLAFGHGFTEVRRVEKSPSATFFYVYGPFNMLIERVQAIVVHGRSEGQGGGR